MDGVLWNSYWDQKTRAAHAGGPENIEMGNFIKWAILQRGIYES
jgi:hypothetical protein